LEGLEGKEVFLSECLEQKDFRLEADFWIQRNHAETKTIKGSEIIDFVQYGTSKELIEEQEGYPILRLNEFNSRFIDVPKKYCKLISQDDFEALKLRKNDVLICRTNGNPNLVGKCALVAEDVEYAYASYLFKIRPQNELINSATLVAFLSCKYGRKEIDKYSMTSNQTNFSPAKFREIEVPLFSSQTNHEIEQLYYSAFNKLKHSEKIYRQAEELLLEAIGLKDFKPSEKGTNIKSFKESFLATGRLDAEYYLPKYEDIIDVVKKFRNGFANFDLFIDSYSTGYPYKSETYINENGIPLVRINNLTKEGLNLSNAVHIPKEDLNLSKKDIAQENDILISMSGTIGLSCVVRENSNIVVNQRIMKTTSKNYNPHVLSMLLNSIIGKYQLERIGTGGVQTNISSNDIKNIIIPVIDNPIQQQIAALIEESFYLRGESEKLLSEAKEMVEGEIEGGGIKRRKILCPTIPSFITAVASA